MKVNGVNIKGISCDSRKIKNGYAFVAIKGEITDGNEYIDSAIENGATIVFTERDIKGKDVPIVKVENARIKLSELLNEFYDHPSKKIKLIGVTGTNGKTTTTYLIEEILRTAGYKTGLIGTTGVKIQNEYISSNLTTPEPEVLFDLVDKMVKENVDVAVMEVSSHGLKFYRTHGLDFDVAIHTNIEKDHMNLHKTLEDYIKTKKMLFDSLRRNRTAIINVDDSHGLKLMENNDKVFAITYGLNNKSTITASSLNFSNNIKFTVCLQRGVTTIDGKEIEPMEFTVTLNLLGKHNVYNALAAIAVSLYFGIEEESIRKALKNFKGVSRRLNKIYEKEYLIIDDFSHNPASYEAVFETMQTLPYDKLIIVNAIRGNRGAEVNEDNARVIAEWNKILRPFKLILTLSQEVVGNIRKVKEEEIEAYIRILDENNIDYVLYNNLSDSIEESLSLAGKNDIILLLGGHGMDKGEKIVKEFTPKTS